MHSRNTVLLALLITLAVQTIAVFAFQNPVVDGHLNGADSYMRLNRVLNLYETGDWYDGFEYRTNAPYGELIHWTRPLDAILITGAWIGSAFTEFPRALFGWGILVGPALLLVLVPIWSWGTRPVLSSGGFLLTFAIFPLFSLLNGTFRPGNPDHHGLIALLFFTLIAILVRLASGQASPRAAVVAGLVAGTAIWVGIVEVVAATFAGSAIALLWLWRGTPYDRHLSAYVIGLMISITLALIVERPPAEWLAPFYERLSFVHLFVAVEVAVAWFVVSAAMRRIAIDNEHVARFATLAIIGVISIAAVALVFPRFFQAPLVEVGSPLIDEWLANNIEFQSVWPVTHAAAKVFFANLGAALIALAFMVWRWKSASAELRNVFAVLLLGFAFYLPLGLNAVRWISFVQALTLLPFVMTIIAVWRWDGAFAFAGQQVRLRSMAATSVLFGPLLATAVVVAIGSTKPDRVQQAEGSRGVLINQAERLRLCNVQAVSDHLAGSYQSGSNDEVLFTYLNWGAEIVWRTPYKVVGAPYANLASMTDTARVFQASADADAATVIRQRGVDLVLVCTGSFEQYPRGEPANLHTRLVDSSPPAWLEPVDLPAHLATTFRLYRVNADVLPR